MGKQVDPELADSENPEWTDEMFANARRGTSAAKRGRPVGSNKVSTTIRLDADIVEAFRADGKGWQSRINSALREWLDKRAS